MVVVGGFGDSGGRSCNWWQLLLSVVVIVAAFVVSGDSCR